MIALDIAINLSEGCQRRTLPDPVPPRRRVSFRPRRSAVDRIDRKTMIPQLAPHLLDRPREQRAASFGVTGRGGSTSARPGARVGSFTPRPPTKVNEPILGEDTLAALSMAKISAVSQLGTASSLAQRPEFSSGVELFGNRLRAESLRPLAQARARPRRYSGLRVVEGLTLSDLWERFGLNRERYGRSSPSTSTLRGRHPALKENTGAQSRTSWQETQTVGPSCPRRTVQAA